jgi:hypothetical protein
MAVAGQWLDSIVRLFVYGYGLWESWQLWRTIQAPRPFNYQLRIARIAAILACCFILRIVSGLMQGQQVLSISYLLIVVTVYLITIFTFYFMYFVLHRRFTNPNATPIGFLGLVREALSLRR